MPHKAQALFQIIVIVAAIFSISVFEASPAKAAEQACCERTKQGETCQYTTSDQCDPAFTQSQNSCSATQFCGNVCCYQQNTGICSNAVPLSTCLTSGGTAIQGSCSANSACSLGCCQLGDNYQLTTEQQCRQISSAYPQLTGQDNFDEAIQDEIQCVQQVNNQEEGCCVSEGTCSYTSREICDAPQQQLDGSDGFYPNTFCSSPSLNCNACEPHARKGCYQDNVYWLDSCGNREDIAENCNAEQACQTQGNDAQCASINCETTQAYQNNADDPITGQGGARLHGESWCVYEGPTGDFLDYPGTRHYRHYCFEGKEYAEECRDYREEICIQGSYTTNQGATRSEAKCLPNFHKSETGYKFDSNVTTVPLGQAFWERKKTAERSAPQASAAQVCKKGKSTCDIYYAKAPLGGWECVANCECEEQAWFDDAAMFCKAQGDCGPDYNIIGKKSVSNIKVKIDGDWSVGDLPQPSAIKASKKYWKSIQKQGVFGNLLTLSKSYSQLLRQYYDKKLATSESYNSPGRKDIGFYYHTEDTTTFIVEILATIITGGGYLLLKFILGSWFDKIIKLASKIISIFSLGLIPSWDPDDEKISVKVLCKPYIPPKKGEDCGRCTEDKLHPCTEYKCKSLGTTCALINADTEQAECIDDSPYDTNSPAIEAWPEAITPGYQAQPTPKGYIITPSVPAWNFISFGITTDEPALCSYDTKHTAKREEMAHELSDYYKREHNTTLALLAGSTHSLYARCEDAHGNENLEEYEIIITTGPAPDLTPPLIKERSIENNAYLPYNTPATQFSIKTNEPSQCRYDKEDKDYANMNFRFFCNNNTEISEDGYGCDTVLTNLSAGSNIYYLRCMDNQGNANQQSQQQTLRVTSTPLTITTLQPQEITYQQNTTLLISTQGGVNNNAICSFSTTNLSYTEFFQTGSTQHRQALDNLFLGQHTYYTSCRDIAGNIARNITGFFVAYDQEGPKILYIYKDSAAVHMLFDEPAACASHTQPFAEGSIAFSSPMKDHTFQIQGEELYVQCMDKDNNQGPLMTILL